MVCLILYLHAVTIRVSYSSSTQLTTLPVNLLKVITREQERAIDLHRFTIMLPVIDHNVIFIFT